MHSRYAEISGGVIHLQSSSYQIPLLFDTFSLSLCLTAPNPPHQMTLSLRLRPPDKGSLNLSLLYLAVSLHLYPPFLERKASFIPKVTPPNHRSLSSLQTLDPPIMLSLAHVISPSLSPSVPKPTINSSLPTPEEFSFKLAYLFSQPPPLWNFTPGPLGWITDFTS